jgi:hypothetical protein
MKLLPYESLLRVVHGPIQFLVAWRVTEACAKHPVG